MFTLLIISLYAVSFDSVHTLKGDGPYYVRSKPVEFRVEPLDFITGDNNIPLVHTFTCNISIEPIISSFKPSITWRYNGSRINKTNTPEMNETVTGDVQVLSQLTTVYPGTYQCVVDDGYFVTVSREARLAFKGEPNITIMTADIRADITVKYHDTSQTTIPYNLHCSDGLSDNKESSNSSNSTLTTRTWFVNGNKHHVHGRELTIRIGSDVLDVVGIYQCFVRNYTHEISVAYRLIAEELPNPSTNMVFNVLKTFSQFNLTYVNLSWDIDKNLHIPREDLSDYLRQTLEIIDDDDLCYIKLDGDIVSTQVMLRTHHLYKIRVVSGFHRGKCSESYFYIFQWPDHAKGMVRKEDMFNCSKFYYIGRCRYSEVELVKNGDLNIVPPECEYNGNKLDCNFTWAANSSYESNLTVICPGQEIEEVENKVQSNMYNPIRISDKPRIQCGSSCNLTIKHKTSQSQSIVKGFNFIKPKPPVVREAYWKHINGYFGLSLDLNITDYQATCGSIQNCTLYGNEEILTLTLNCSALNLAENLSHFVWISDYDRLHLKAVNISVSYTSDGGESQRSNTIEVRPLIPESDYPGVHEGYLAFFTLIIPIIGFAVVLGAILCFRHKERTENVKMKKVLSLDYIDQESSDRQSTVHDDMTVYDCCLKADEYGNYQTLQLPQYECY